MVPNYVKGMLYGTMVESYAAEQNARMSAMDSATENGKEIVSQLSLQYNRSVRPPSPPRSPRLSAARRHRSRADLHPFRSARRAERRRTKGVRLIPICSRRKARDGGTR